MAAILPCIPEHAPLRCPQFLAMRKPVEIAPAVIQTIAAAAPKIFFLTRRCLKGRNVACVLSKEIAPTLINDAKVETVHNETISGLA